MSFLNNHRIRICPMHFAASFLALVLGASFGCGPDADAGPTCAKTEASKSSALEGSCRGSARSCSSFGVSSSDARSACAYQEGCYPDFDSMSCRGTVHPCSGLSETYCGYQQGCTWDDGSSSGGGGGGGGVPKSDPCSGTKDGDKVDTGASGDDAATPVNDAGGGGGGEDAGPPGPPAPPPPG